MRFPMHAVAILSLAAGTVVRPAAAALVGYWKFDEGRGAVARDSSGHGHDGTVIGARWVEGLSGRALEFTGSEQSYVEVPHSEALSPRRAVTVTAWAKVRHCRTWHSCLVYKAGDAPHAYGFGDRCYTLWVTDMGGLHFTSTPENEIGQVRGDARRAHYEPGQWAHFAMVVDCGRGMMTGYINGEPVAQAPYPTTRIRGGEFPLRLGGYWESLGDQSGLNGVLDEVRIYDHALSAREIEDDMAAGEAGRLPTGARSLVSSGGVSIQFLLVEAPRSVELPAGDPLGALVADRPAATLIDAPATAVATTLQNGGRVQTPVSQTLFLRPDADTRIDWLGVGREGAGIHWMLRTEVLDWERRLLELRLEGVEAGDRLCSSTVIVRSGWTAAVPLTAARRGDTRRRFAVLTPRLIATKEPAATPEPYGAIDLLRLPAP